MPLTDGQAHRRLDKVTAEASPPVQVAPMSGKETRSQQAAPQPAGNDHGPGRPPTAAEIRAATQRLAPWVMDDASMSAMGLAPLDGEAEGSHDRAHDEASGEREDPRASASGSEGMWRHVIGERSTPVGKLGRVSAPRGVRLRRGAAAGAPELGILPFNELVSVERRTEHGWCWVISTGALAGSAGFCEEQFLAMDPPEPTADLYRVTPGDELREIAERAYGKSFRGGRDARLYVQALYEANKGQKGIYLTDVKLSGKEQAERFEEDEHTLEVFRGAKVREGHAIWLPSEAFIEQQRTAGILSDGTPAHAQLARGLKSTAGHAVDGARYSAAFVVGLLEGSWGAIADLFQGAADLIETVAKTFYELVTGDLGAIKDMLLGWVEKLKVAWAHRGDMAADFMAKWESDDAWTRGNFQGEVLGWVMMTALLIFATAGEAAVAMATGKWATVLRVLRAADALGDITAYASKAARLPGKAADVIRRKVGKGADVATNVAEPAAVKEGQHLAGEAAEVGRDGPSTTHASQDGAERPRAGGGKYGVDLDSGMDMLTDPHPPAEVLEVRRQLPTVGDMSKVHDAKDAFRKLMRVLLGRRAREVDSVLHHLKQATGTGLERVPRGQLEEVFDYLFQSNGISSNYANYAAWRRVSTGEGTVDDLRFLHHELEELKMLRQGGLEDPLGQGLSGRALDDWRIDFLDKHYLPAHQKALDAELVFLSREVRLRTEGFVDLSPEELAMSDSTRNEGRIHAIRNGVPIESHADAEKMWDRGSEKVEIPASVANRFNLLTITTINDVIQAVKTSRIGSIK